MRNILSAIFFVFITSIICACSNSEYPDYSGNDDYTELADNSGESIGIINQTNDEKTASSGSIDYLPLDDTEYPYAGIPRIVIETENHRTIKDRETEIPAKLQIWGETEPESEIMNLTIRGRGNSSWETMPKKSYKIEFTKKQTMFGMPKDKDWALISNYADKTLMKNYLMYHLSAKLNAYYAPQCEFVELYINRDYLGVYLIVETIKTSPHRINIPKDENSYIVESDGKAKKDEQIIYPNTIKNGKAFKIHAPQNASNQSLTQITKHIKNFELFLKNINEKNKNDIARWVDINECLKHYWVQEFSKNPDAGFYKANFSPEQGFFTSVYFSWIKDSTIRMGPVWDFDLAFGGHMDRDIDLPQKWHFKDSYWNAYLFKDSILEKNRQAFWINNIEVFYSVLDLIDSIHILLQEVQKNNFKKWPILQSTAYYLHPNAFPNYDNAIDELKFWIRQRILWISENISVPKARYK